MDMCPPGMKDYLVKTSKFATSPAFTTRRGVVLIGTQPPSHQGQQDRVDEGFQPSRPLVNKTNLRVVQGPSPPAWMLPRPCQNGDPASWVRDGPPWLPLAHQSNARQFGTFLPR